MADTFTWTQDANSGILKNHQLSKKLREVALGKCVVMPFTHDHEIGFKKNAGETVNLMHVTNLPDDDSSLVEEGQIPILKPAFGNRAITMREFGKGVQFTEYAENLLVFKPSQFLKKLLTEHLERALDTESAAAFMDTSAVLIGFTPTSAIAGTWHTDGTAGGVTVTHALSVDHCKIISAYMRDSIHVPFYEDDNYVGLTCNKNIEALLNDRRAEQWQHYAQKVEFFYKGEMCMTYRIRWVEVNRAPAFSNTAGSSSTLGEGVVFGDDAVARLEAVTPHLRLNPNYQGRFATVQAMAWWGIMAWGSVWNSADDGKAKIIQLRSA